MKGFWRIVTVSIAALLPVVAWLVVGCSGVRSGGNGDTQDGLARRPAVPVVFIPGMTGTRLEDPTTGEVIWGGSRQLIRPRDGGYRIALPLGPDMPGEPGHSQQSYFAAEPLWELRLPGWTKPIYRPLAERFEREGYRRGRLHQPRAEDRLYFFNYDWRYGNLATVRQLHSELENLSKVRGAAQAIDLICQSNAAKICRYLVKYGARPMDEVEAGTVPDRSYRIRKVILVGASNGGAMRVLQLMNRGRRYVALVGRTVQPEVFFTLRPLFADLPDGADLFLDRSGRALDVDLFDPENWVRYGWSIFQPKVERRLRDEPREDLFGSGEERLAYLAEQLRGAQRMQRLLAAEISPFPGVQYYRLENRSKPTFARAVLTERGGVWRTLFFKDRLVSVDPRLRTLASEPGDGHATLSSQRHLSPQEESAVAGSALIAGGHFEMIIEPEGLDALLGFLAE